MTGQDIDAEIARKRALIAAWREGIRAEREASAAAERLREFWNAIEAKRGGRQAAKVLPMRRATK